MQMFYSKCFTHNIDIVIGPGNDVLVKRNVNYDFLNSVNPFCGLRGISVILT